MKPTTEPTGRRRRKGQKPPIAIEATLTDWAERGAVSAQSDGHRILVDKGIPGERVVALMERRQRPWRGVVDQVIEPAEERVDPPCPYFLQGCGGCQWQHLNYRAQVETRRRLVNRDMEQAGLKARVEVVHSMSDPWRYRRTAAIAIGWEAGFRPRRRRGILEVRDCLISHPLIGYLSDRLNDLLRAGSLPNYHGKVWLNCTIAGSSQSPSVQVLLQGIEGLTLETYPEILQVGQIIGRIEGVCSVAYRHRSGEPTMIVGTSMSPIEVGGRTLHVPAGSFFQTNLEMLAAVTERMRSVLRDLPVHHVADVYSGVGALGLPLAEEVSRMTLVELDPLAIRAAQQTAIEWRLENVDFVTEHTEQALPKLPTPDLLIVDPPRSGLGDVVCEAILQTKPPFIFYLSCLPASLARDLAALEAGGYHIRSLELFDFYPQTYHVESLAVLAR